MEIYWNISDKDVKAIQQFIKNNYNYFVENRIKKNIEKKNVVINKNEIIKVLIMCLLTSQQRSGPNTPIARFFNLSDFPLTYEKLKNTDNIKEFVRQTLLSNDLKRFNDRISKFFAQNFENIEKDNWNILSLLKGLLKDATKFKERKVADYLNEWIIGFGPKQSRNFIQTLGLTKYEIPIDSRVTKWLNNFGFPVTLTASSLNDKNYYHFVLDGIQALCETSNTYPCILDAAIFSSFDKEDWNENNMLY